MKSAMVVLASLTVLLGCGEPTGLATGSLGVRATPPVLQLSNRAHVPVYSFAVEREMAALINWAPCANATGCNPLAPGESRSEPYSSIAFYTPDAREAIVYWWHLVPDGRGGVTPDSVRAVVIGL